jgi:hypothetical protein
MGKAVIHVSTKILTKLLKLPEGYNVDSVHASSSYFNRDGLSFFISSDKISEVDEGREYPLAVPTYRVDEHNNAEVLWIDIIGV